MRTYIPPPARVAIGTAKGPNGPVEFFVNEEWARFFNSLNTLTNDTATGSGGVAEINADDAWHDDLQAREAQHGVDELRNEIGSLRTDNAMLRQMIDELSSVIAETRPSIDYRQRIEQLEDRLN